jgi:hypothetical protein
VTPQDGGQSSTDVELETDAAATDDPETAAAIADEDGTDQDVTDESVEATDDAADVEVDPVE